MSLTESGFLKRVIIIGSSMAMPRPQVGYEATWIYKLIKAFPQIEFIDKSKRASSVMRLVNEGGALAPFPAGADLLELYKPNLVIMQLGGTDAAPRYYKKRSLEGYLVDRMMTNSIRSKYLKTVKKIRDRNPDWTDVSLVEFENILRAYFKRAKAIGTRVIAVKIAEVPKYTLTKTPHIAANFARFNKVFEAVANEFPETVLLTGPLNGIDIEPYAVDEFHVNEKGHLIVFDDLQKLVKKEFAL